MKNPLIKITGLHAQPWMKIPYGTISLLKKCGYSSSESLVVLYFFMKLDINPIDESTVVFTTSQEVMNFCGITRRVFYKAIEVMTGKGLVKTAPHTYEMKGFLEKIDKRGDYYIVQGNT
jgi:hypothetical protein